MLLDSIDVLNLLINLRGILVLLMMRRINLRLLLMRLIGVDIVLIDIGVGSVLVATICDRLIVTVGDSGRGVRIFLRSFHSLDFPLNI